MPKDTNTEPDGPTIEWAGVVWQRLTQQECAGVLWIACRYDSSRTDAHTLKYIDTMSQLAWRELGRMLQADLARTFQHMASQLRR